MNMQRLADYVISRLSELGISHLFYVSGGQCVYLTDALRRSESIKGICTHHEQAAAMAAIAYATINERLGACLVTTGCAGTNTLTAVLHAYQDSIPLIIISGQQVYSQTVKASGLPLRQVGIQEADIETIVKPITKYSFTVSDPKSIAWHMDKALHLAMSGRKGPVWIDLPLNVQNTMIDESALSRWKSHEEPLSPRDTDLEYVKQALSHARRPVILAGNGVRSAGAKKELRALCESLNCPVVMSRLADDILPFDHPLNFGLIGGVAGANRYANFTVQNSDLLLVVGSRLSIEVTGPERADFAREATKIVCDVDRIEHTKDGARIDRFIHADARLYLKALSELELPRVSSEWVEKCRHWKEIFTYPMDHKDDGPMDMKILMTLISKRAPQGTFYVSDAGFTGACAPARTILREGERFVMALSQGEMGFALPAGCGVCTLTDGPVVSYNGDGSVMMNLQELQTVVRNHFNLKLVIINNDGYSGVRHGQKAHFRGKTMGTDPTNGLDFPDFGKVAAAFGIPYKKAQSYSEAMRAVDEMFESNGPFVLEAVCDPEQFDLHNGLVMYGKRKFGFRPIEDQSPYIDRDIFFKEMIVKPLETSSGKPV